MQRVFLLVGIISALTLVGRATAGENQKPATAKQRPDIPAFGGKENEERLRRSIHDTVAVPPRKIAISNQAESLLRWSEPVGGLTARIEFISHRGSCGFTVLVRLKNVSRKALTVPTGNPIDDTAEVLFQLHTQPFDGSWKRSYWRPEESPGRPRGHRGEYGGNARNRFARPRVTLQPGESCLAYLCGDRDSPQQNGEIVNASQIKAVLNVPAAKNKDGWSGILETAPYPSHVPDELINSLKATIPCPEHLPQLNSHRQEFASGSGSESDVEMLQLSNAALLSALRLYEPAGLQREFDRRMQAEKDFPLKLVCAEIASSAGSEKAALFLMESMRSTKYEVFDNLHETLESVLRDRENDPPDWLQDLIAAALTDERMADTSGTRITFGDGSPHKMSYFADFSYALGSAKSRKLVPFFIERVKRNQGELGAMSALGRIGDPQAVPLLLECLQRAAKTVQQKENYGLDREFSAPLHALADLKAKAAIPILLQYIEFPDVIEALGEIGDERALPAIRQVVVSQGKLIKDGKLQTPYLDQKRWFAARIAEAELSSDAIPPLCMIVEDQKLDTYQRIDAMWRLRDRPDPRAIPVLIRAIKSDPEGTIMNQAIRALGAFKYKATVEGLIECFDVNFDGKQHYRLAYRPEMFRESIGESLRSITGASIGPSKKQWQRWWQKHGSEIPLK